ncbi:PIN domain-containing protein [Arthrobacter subterraneus]|uniref:PIN domain-containing protein n=1 Tax=Arthrobacter subterraneus TaxID=335973 RepID=A0A1G8NG51_9MICC|nr:PIN domain-containing protein [Arthrobacter subterraneus]SDI79056.1 PIN domain-containing protein [Arthrobacter subterraneus]
MRPGATLIFLDANVLFSRTLRDWFALISKRSGANGIELRWSEDVLVEWLYNLRRMAPGKNDSGIGGLRRNLEAAFPNALVSGYVVGPELLEGGDEFDAHVLAAADHGYADYLVTDNTSDFAPFKDAFGFEIYNSDEMLCLILERRLDAVRGALLDNLAYWSGKSDAKDLVEALIDAGAPQFADGIKRLRSALAMSGKY